MHSQAHSILTLANEAATRRDYERFCKRPSSPKLTFEQYALAYGEKRVPTEAEIRAEYERLCADLKATYPGAVAEFHGVPTLEEFKLSFMEDHEDAA